MPCAVRAGLDGRSELELIHRHKTGALIRAACRMGALCAIGPAPEHEARLFQPFFTTKPVGQGTGLGLSVSYGIIDSLGGSIGYRRALAGGAIFYFDLPAAQAETLPRSVPKSA